MKWELAFPKQALKYAEDAKAARLKPKVEELLAIFAIGPFKNPPTFGKPVGDLSGAYSRRIDIHNRLVYEVFSKERLVRVLRLWTLCE